MFGLDLAAIVASGIAAFIPAGIDIIKGAANRWIGGGAQMQPSNFAEYLEMQKADVSKIEALAKIDALPIGASLWVVNLRGSVRYIVILQIFFVWVVTAVASIWVPVSDHILQWVGSLASSAMFFILGERVNLMFKATK